MQQFDYYLAQNTNYICCGVNLAGEIWENYCCLFWGPIQNKILFNIQKSDICEGQSENKFTWYKFVAVWLSMVPSIAVESWWSQNMDDHKMETVVTWWLI